MEDLVTNAILQDIVRFAKRAPSDDLVIMAQGNISARDPRTGYVAITPHEMPYQDMLPTDLVIVDVDGSKVAGDREPSFETPVHCAVYRARPEVLAVIHTEPPHVNALGAVQQEIPPITSTMLKMAGGTIPVMPFNRSGSEEFAQEMLKLMGNRNAIVWANHGMLVLGPSVEIAYSRSYAIEQGARTLLLALQIGKPKTLAWIEDVGLVAE